MATILKPKRTRTLGLIPTVSDLAVGEIAVNIPDQKIYINDEGTIKVIAQGAAASASPWTYVNTNITLSTQGKYIVDCRSSARSLAMPSVSLTAGDYFELSDPFHSWGTNAVTLVTPHPVGDELGNVDVGPVFLDVSGAKIMFIWTGSYWRLQR